MQAECSAAKRDAPKAPLVAAGTAAPLDAACGVVAIAPLVPHGYNEYTSYFRAAAHRHQNVAKLPALLKWRS
jgi:hypothetical protein